MDFEQLKKFFNNKDTDILEDLSDSLTFVSLSLDKIYDKINDEISVSLRDRDFSKQISLIELLKSINSFQTEINNITEILLDKDENEIQKEIDESLSDEDTEKKEIIDYSTYQVDTTIPHSLKESFTHKRPCGFSISGNYFPVSDMRSILINTCEYLAKENITIMQSFLKDPIMKGKKCTYFLPHNVNQKNIIIPGTNIYIWINLSCNAIRNLLIKILNKYKINQNQFYIYLRADYTDLHK